MNDNSTAQKIRKTIEEIVALEAVNRHAQTVDEELERILAKKDEIEDRMIKELEDINALEKLGVKSIFHQVLGNKQEQLEKERQEYLHVTLEHKEILKSLEVTTFEKEVLDKKLISLDELHSKLAGLKKAREEEILSTPGPIRNQLLLLVKKMDQIKRYEVELAEARSAGKQLEATLQSMYGHFKKAKDWGNYDMSSNSRYYKSMKHGSIDRGMQELSNVKLHLRRFSKELQDIGYNNTRLSLQIDSISKFPGMIFDNLISDWIVQNKIKGALSSIGNLIDDVNLIQQSMQKDKQDSEGELSQLDSLYQKVLEEQ